ncbi:endonuclease domain-containing protein [Devosia sp. PTR5]|uniref:UDP-N-acetyl-alpha-D-muramoyl-L-alanyl-L-glutamate epimerase n=1 Tax=Devosia oryzisoli TaxID=2774138 RepID=A0A927INW8_9HYPH|nr:endonuclease domain-containing protein [Devosia oryzisoli]MBD8063915.1 endonuclease domain-containing protein [Devosia oryzisoli]
MTEFFRIECPQFDPDTSEARFSYRLNDLAFTEVLRFPHVSDIAVLDTPSFQKLLGLCAIVLGVSYFKLRAPLRIETDIALTPDERAFVLDVYENGLGEFYARNGLQRFGRLSLDAPEDDKAQLPAPVLKERTLLPIGGGKDSLVSVDLLTHVGAEFTPFAVNPKGPILSSVEAIGIEPVYVTRTLDPEMIRLGKEPGYYNGHVPSTAINSMIAALCALLFGYDQIVLSNERSASEGNVVFDGRETNHQYSKSLGFEVRIADILLHATGGALRYFSLLRPYSEARIASLFTHGHRFDSVFSSCNRNFRLTGNDGPLWCGECPKCHFVFLIFAPFMPKDRLLRIFGKNLLDEPANEHSFRELAGLTGQKPWECVGEILEAAACFYTLSRHADWHEDAVVKALKPDLLAQYGEEKLQLAMAECLTDSHDHHIPPALAAQVAAYAV